MATQRNPFPILMMAASTKVKMVMNVTMETQTMPTITMDSLGVPGEFVVLQDHGGKPFSG